MSTTSSVPMESKSAKKRRAKADAGAALATTNSADSHAVNGTITGSAGDNSTESPYIKELSKQIRNIHKKLSASAKADAVVDANPGISLDELLTEKKINADQRAQLLKKPQLQAQLTQLEEQHTHYKSFAQDLEERFRKEKAALAESHEAEIEKLKEEATKSAKSDDSDNVEESLQVISHFLHAAAAKRVSGEPETEESRAYEGVLLQIYQGNETALDTLRNLIEGSDGQILDNENTPLNFTFAQLKMSALSNAGGEAGEAPTEPEYAATTEDPLPTTDPTIAHAGLTEREDTIIVTTSGTDGDAEREPPVAAPEQSSTTAEAANAVAESGWDAQASMTTENTATGEDWIKVPHDPTETDTGASAPTQAQQNTSSWADEAGAAAEEKGTNTPATPENDGFSEVRRERGRGRGGRGGRGDGRGRGRGRGEFRGRGGGRGRGGNRGGAAPSTP